MGMIALLILVAQDLAVGEVAEGSWNNGWYEVDILKIENGKYFVHWRGYGDSSNEWLARDRLRKKGEKPAPPPAPKAEPGPAAPQDLAVGEIAEASWNNSWYEIEILKFENGKYFVHWRGYGESSREWLPRDRIRKKGEDKEVLPRQGREGDGGGQPPEKMVGQKVEVYWHGKWYDATVDKTDGKRLFIKYEIADRSGGTREEWVVKERVRAVGGAARIKVDWAQVPGKKGLSGLWYRYVQVTAGVVHREHFYFFSDGRVIKMVPPNGVESVSYEWFQKEYPHQAGGYGIENDKMNLEFGGDADPVQPMAYERIDDDTIKLNGLSTHRTWGFEDGERLEGTYRYIMGGGTGGADMTSVSTWTFRADGTFDYRSVTGMAARDGRGARGEKEEIKKGTYRFSGQTLTSTYENGEVNKSSVYPCWKKGEKKDRFVLMDGEYRLQ